MIYVIGDIHGRKDKYDEMLEKIKPTDEDAVFVLGDVIDVGDDSIALLQDMMYRPFIYPVLGEREYMAKKILPLIRSADSIEEAKALLEGENLELFEKWLSMGSEKTVKDFLSLDDEGKESILDYLTEFQPYEELDVGGRTFVLVHAGIRNFDPIKPLEDYDDEDFVSEAADYTRVYFRGNTFLVTGHTPTVAIDKKYFGKVYAHKSHLAVDCGAAFGGRLACVCLDKMKLYYC